MCCFYSYFTPPDSIKKHFLKTATLNFNVARNNFPKTSHYNFKKIYTHISSFILKKYAHLFNKCRIRGFGQD